MLLFSVVISNCEDHVSFRAYPFNRSVVPSAQVLFILSSLASLLNRSAVQSCSSSSSLLMEVFNFVHIRCILCFEFVQPRKVLWFHSFVKEATQLYLSSFSPVFPPVPFQISGRDPLVVVECCDAPRPMLEKTSMCSGFRRVFHLCPPFYLCIASCHHVISFLNSTN